MDQQTLTAPETPISEAPGRPAENFNAHAASALGIVGLVIVAGVLALMTSAIITAATTPDFMPIDITDDSFFGTGLASVLPLIFGLIGLGLGIAALAKVRILGEKRVAIRGLVFGLLNTLIPIAVIALMINFDQQVAACGGG